MGGGFVLTKEEMKKWIDAASYSQLLSRWRFAPVGSPWFQGEIGDYFAKVMREKRKHISDAEHSGISKTLGW